MVSAYPKVIPLQPKFFKFFVVFCIFCLIFVGKTAILGIIFTGPDDVYRGISSFAQDSGGG